MNGLTYTLLGDGTSDRLLDYPIRWTLEMLQVAVELGQWADPKSAGRRPQSLAERVRAAIELYPAQLLLIHRDAEREPLAGRVQEIQEAIAGVAKHYVAVVPVRMTEAWLLHDEQAIRRASGNPNGRAALRLPEPAKLENLPDPKAMLERALLEASELTGRRREKLKKEFPQMRARTAELIEDYSPLSKLEGFRAFRTSLESALMNLGHL